MPRYIGTAGEFQQEKATNRRARGAAYVMLTFAVLAFVDGWAAGYLAGSKTLISVLLLVFGVAMTALALKLFGRFVDKQIRLARMEEDGAAGEREFIKYVKDLPDTYTVISDLEYADSFGNVDHLIVGPNGVFAIDVKNWRGVVSSDGKGELLYNGRPTDTRQVRAFTRRAMELKERIQAIAKLDPYVQCVFVFLHTRVEAKWGTTGAVHCIRPEQITEYVLKGKGGRSLAPGDVARVVHAVEALRKFDADGAPVEQPAAKT